MAIVTDDPTVRSLLLASRSPRRAMLLHEAGFDFARFDPPFADPANPNDAVPHTPTNDAATDGGTLAVRLAERKARSVPAEAIPPDAVVLCADTIGVTPEGELIGTPQTPDQARVMLKQIIGRPHTIVTGVALCVANHEPFSFADTATVNLGQVDDAAVRAYIETGDWRGKAGGYNLAERLEAGWPITVEGDPGTVMGLPMRRLTPRLIAYGIPCRRPASTPAANPRGACV